VIRSGTSPTGPSPDGVRPVPQDAQSNNPSPPLERSPGGAARRRSVPTLRVIAGPDLLRFVTLSPNRQLRIGREPSTDLPLSDPTVSKQHARVVVDAKGDATVFDLQSTNGTAVNNRRIRRAPLRAGDHLEVGDVSLRLDLLTQDELNHLARVSEHLEAPGREPHTGLLLRTYVDADLTTLADQCVRASVSFSCLAVSIDRVDEVRDLHGSGTIHEVKVSTARQLMLGVRDDDPCMRWDDATVLVFLPGSSETSAAEVAERLRRQIAGHDWARTAPHLLVTVSIGVAARRAGESLSTWVERASEGARVAAASGRNRVERAGMHRGRGGRRR